MAKERAGFPGYEFGLADEEVSTARQPLEDLPATDGAGKAKFNVSLDKLPASTHPLEAKITVRMAEAGGRAVERTITLPVSASGAMIGVKPQFSGRSLSDGATAAFDVIVVMPDGTAAARRGLHYELQRVDTHYQFYKRDGRWNYAPVKTATRVADGTADAAADKPARISLPVTFGRYRLEVSTGDPDGPMTSLAFDAGFYVRGGTPIRRFYAGVALDQNEYRAGDTMTVAVTARSAGRLTLNVIGDRLLASNSGEVKPGAVQVKMPVGRDWGSGAYVVATLRRPLDAPAQRMPGRSIGVRWFSIDHAAKTLTLDLNAPPLLRPNSTLRVPIKVGLPAGAEARVAVAAVDVGILNLTNYKPPSPDDYYLGQRTLSADIRDLYGDLIDGMQGARGQIRSGGDAGAEALQGNPPTGPPVALSPAS